MFSRSFNRCIHFSLVQVEKAEGILLQIRKTLDQNQNQEQEDVSELNKLNREFYKLIPHQSRRDEFINSRRIIASKQELCQVSVTLSGNNSTKWENFGVILGGGGGGSEFINLPVFLKITTRSMVLQ